MELNILPGNKMFKVVETFSGIGAQAKALNRIGIDFDIVNTCDWDVNAMTAYAQIHKNGLEIAQYKEVPDDEIDDFLKHTTLSMDGKKAASTKVINNLTKDFKRIVYSAIKQTNNFVSIKDVKGQDIKDGIDLLTYSFPCQDLSLCGCWHGNKTGISRTANNRSGLLWEVERILKEMHDLDKELPHFLMMENVTNILSATHKKDFDEWKNTLSELGYFNKIYKLNAKNFGVPQKRERAYMISVFVGKNDSIRKLVELFFTNNNLEDLTVSDKYKSRIFKLKNVLKLDYSQNKYKYEADINQPNNTPSRVKIFEDNDLLYNGKEINEICVNTLTTKQDRNPNSGTIFYDSLREGKARWRYLTPRECFILMGFDEKDYEKVVSCNPLYNGKNILFTNEKLTKLAGNSICVDVLEAIFKQIYQLNELIKQYEAVI